MFLETLPPHTQSLLKQLGRLPAVASFYLGGGTAVALHLGHRVSVDLDFFAPQPDYATEPLIQDLQTVGPLVIRQQSRGTLEVTLQDTQASFFAYPYPLLEEPVTLWGVRVAGLLDLAMMKLIAISQRGQKRDFVDLYHICRHGYTLDDLLARLDAKFPRVRYSTYHLVRALAYFDDAETDPTPAMRVPFDWTAVKHFFEQETRRLMSE